MKRVRYPLDLDEDLKKAFLSAAKANDKNGAQLLRDFMREYVKKNSQKDLFRDGR